MNWFDWFCGFTVGFTLVGTVLDWHTKGKVQWDTWGLWVITTVLNVSRLTGGTR